MTIWIGGKREVYDGMLMALNCGDDRVGGEFVADAAQAVAEAHARGWVVLYLFDEDGPRSPAGGLEFIEGHDFVRVEDGKISLPGDYEARRARLEEMRERLSSDDERYLVKGGSYGLLGACSMGGQEVLVPPTYFWDAPGEEGHD